MLEVGSQDGSAEFGNIGNNEARSELCPTDKLGRFWIDNHPGAGHSESTAGTGRKNSLLIELGDKIVGGDRFSAERARLGCGFQRIFLAATVAPAISGTSGDSVSV